MLQSPVKGCVSGIVTGQVAEEVPLLAIATARLGNVQPYHYWDFISDRALFAGVDVGGVADTPNWVETGSPVYGASGVAFDAGTDVITITSPGVDYPLSLFIEFERTTDTGASEGLIAVDGGNTANRAVMFVSSTDKVTWFSAVASATVFNAASAASVATSTVAKAAARYTTNDMRGALNQTLGTQDTSAAQPSTPTHIRFGALPGISSFIGRVRRVAIFNFAVTDAQLQAMTA